MISRLFMVCSGQACLDGENAHSLGIEPVFEFELDPDFDFDMDYTDTST